MGKASKTLAQDEFYQKLTNKMIGSYAWRSLSGNAVKILIAMFKEVGISRLGKKFPLKVRDIEKLNIPRRYIRQSIDQLVEFGFIVVEEHGGRNTETNAWHTNMYALTDLWRHCTEKSHPGPHIEPKKRTGSLSPLASNHVDTISGNHVVHSRW